MDIDDLATRIELDRRATEYSREVVKQVREADLDRPTPCADWTLRQLLGHMIGHHDGWTGSLTGAPVGGEVWDRTDFDGEIHRAYDDASAAVVAAFGRSELPEKIEVYGYGTIPTGTAAWMHTVDYVVHGWDVAKAIGSDLRPDEDLAEATLAIMKRFPTNRPNVAFDVMVEPVPDASVTDQLMAYVGRDPMWTAPTA
jgi:uncharacterized protein (TIGR03086 family)